MYFSGILNEALFTFFLVTVALILHVDTKTKAPNYGMVMGFSITVGIICG